MSSQKGITWQTNNKNGDLQLSSMSPVWKAEEDGSVQGGSLKCCFVIAIDNEIQDKERSSSTRLE